MKINTSLLPHVQLHRDILMQMSQLDSADGPGCYHTLQSFSNLSGFIPVFMAILLVCGRVAGPVPNHPLVTSYDMLAGSLELLLFPGLQFKALVISPSPPLLISHYLYWDNLLNPFPNSYKGAFPLSNCVPITRCCIHVLSPDTPSGTVCKAYFISFCLFNLFNYFKWLRNKGIEVKVNGECLWWSMGI